MTPESPLPHAVEASTARADVLTFLRTYRPESFELLDAQTKDAAADRLLALRALPYGNQDPEVHEARRTHYNEAEKEQTIPGLRASLVVSTGLFLLVLAGAAAFLIVAWGAFGTEQDLALLAPERFGVLPAIELLLLAPTALVPLYLLFVVSVHWRSRTHGRAVLRVAREEGEAQFSGIPVRSPFHGIWSSWSFLGVCLKWALGGYVAVAAIAWMTDASDAVFIVLAYAAPVALILLPVHLRTKVWKRRDDLLDVQLYRDKHDARSREGFFLDHPLEEGEEEPGSWDEHAPDADEPGRVGEGSRGAEWRTGFSAASAPADHLVDPERRER